MPEAPGDGVQVGAGGQELGGGVVLELLKRAGDANPARVPAVPVGHRVGIPGLATCRVGREREHVFGHLGTDRPGLGTAALESLAEQLAGQKCQVRVPGAQVSSGT